MNKEKISWHALEYKKKEKTADWYWAVVIIAISIAAVAILLQNILFAVLIIIATITLLIFSSREPEIVEVKIDARGIQVNKLVYPFATLDSFWVDISDESNQKILLRSKKIIMPLVVIPIEEHDHLLVREILLDYLPEKEMHEPLSQKIMEKLGF